VTRFSLGFQRVALVPPRGVPRRGSSRAARAAAVLLSLFAAAHGALAEEYAEEEDWTANEPRWIPSLSFGFDTFDYKTDSSVTNSVNPPSQEGAGATSNRQIQLLTDGELMGPIFEGLPGHPRLFAGAGIQFNPFSSDTIFQTGHLGGNPANPEDDIGKFQTLLAGEIAAGCLNFTPPACSTRKPTDFDGQGSDIEANFKQSWHAALGVAFTFPVGEDLLLQLKPSIAYNVDKIDMTGTMTTVTENDPSTWPDPNIPQYTVHRGGASSSTTDHSLGPGLELALALSRSRPIRASLFADTRFLWLVSDPTTTFSDGVARYEIHRDSFGFRAGAGVRLSWVGFGEH
jgi:hypothetical protein